MNTAFELRAANSIRKQVSIIYLVIITGQKGCGELEIISRNLEELEEKRKIIEPSIFLGLKTENEGDVFIFIQALKLTVAFTDHKSMHL